MSFKENLNNFFLSLAYILVCLVATVLIEGLLVLCATRSKKALKASVLCNLLTNPMMNGLLFLVSWILYEFFKIPYFPPAEYYITLAILETAVVFVEAFVYRYLDVKKTKASSIVFSLLINAASAVVGAFLPLFVALF